MARTNKAFRHTGNQPNGKRRQAAQALYASGLSLREVGSALGITWQAAWSLLRRAGVVMRPRGGNTGTHSRHRK